ncbi:uncharacterized protein LOC142904391 isoform X2 [Nelusetta ayraudi]|uniref:uncharacterized protein LOC142904391 isoform X2 n=1 Tax=Nelusetta ayraudi TaxID=303726 RepID=UPI003F7101D0
MRVGERMLRFLLLVLGSVTAVPAFNSTTDLNLTCLNDYVQFVNCEFDGQQCTQYNLSLQNDDENGSCDFTQCGDGRCCCSTVIKPVWGEIINVVVWRGGKRVASKVFSIERSIKPRVPKIHSVQQSNMNFQVKWRSNMETAEMVDHYLEAVVTYYKKGHTKMVSKKIQPSSSEDKQKFKFFEIDGRDLEPSTTYVVSVKSYLALSNRFSDPSEEWEFTTPRSHDTILVATVVILSISAVIIIGAMYCCYSKAKAIWWDQAFKSPNPKLLDMHPSEQKLLKPVLPYISSICIEHLIQDDDKPWSKGLQKDSSDWGSEGSEEVNSGSTVLSYANTAPIDVRAGVQEALGNTFANISPISFISACPASELHKDSGLFSSPSALWGSGANDTNSSSSGFDNKTYSILIPVFPQEIPANGPAAHLRGEIEFDAANHASEGPAAICSEQLLPTPLLLCGGPPGSFVMPTDMSYQQCNAEPESFPHAEAPSVLSLSNGGNSTVSGDPVPRVEAGHGGGPDELAPQLKAESLVVCDENPRYGAVPAGSCGFPAVEDEYQPFQSQVERPGASCSGEPSGDDLERLSATRLPLPTSAQMAAAVQRPFLPLFCADPCTPVITDSGYQCV